MPFNVGDWVVHPMHGVGQVTRLERKQFAKAAQLYYEITIAKGTLWVEVATPPAGLRQLTAKEDLPRYRTVLLSLPVPLSKDYHLRREELRGRLKLGTFQIKCEVVRDLTAHGWQKRLSEVDATLLRSAHDLLCQEWAGAQAVTVAEASLEVDALLREARHTHQK